MTSKLYLLLLAVCCLIAVAIYFPLSFDHPFAYDEADYMWAGKQGWAANYLDRDGIPFPEFVRKGLELSKDPSRRTSFSQYIRSTGDIGMYRHYHGPMYAYWLGSLFMSGVQREEVFRGSGLLLQALTVLIAFLGCRWTFPEQPRFAAFIAGILLLFSRTTLSTSTIITQHLIFAFLTVPALFLFGQYFRTLEPRWAYCAMALTGLALASVETAVLLIGGFLLACLIDWRKQFSRWPTWRARLGFLSRCGLAAVAAIAVVWPPGILQLNVLKGYLQLAYMAIYRKTFAPIGTLDLLASKFMVSPFEWSVLLIGSALTVYFYKKETPAGRALLPWLCFVATFFLVMLKVTLPYTYYYAPLAAAMAVLCGFAAGELWRVGPAARILTGAAVLLSVIGTTMQFSSDLASIRASRPPHFAVLDFVRKQAIPSGRAFHLPFQLVPTLHYYHPEISVTGYDLDWTPQRLADSVTAPNTFDRVVCEDNICRQLTESLPGRVVDRQFLDPVGPNGGTLYSVRILPQENR